MKPILIFTISIIYACPFCLKMLTRSVSTRLARVAVSVCLSCAVALMDVSSLPDYNNFIPNLLYDDLHARATKRVSRSLSNHRRQVPCALPLGLRSFLKVPLS